MLNKINIVYIAAIIASLFLSTAASGVTKTKTVSIDPGIGWVTAEANDRAESDIQIRRLKNLMVSQQVDVDVAFEKLETLQKKKQD